MADLSELNNTLKSLNANISTNNALLSRQAATKTVSDRLNQSRKQEEQREAERRKRLERSGGGAGAGGTGDGSGIPGGARGFISRLFSGKIGLALLGIGGFAALASRMGGGGNALRKLLDSTIGVLLKIVQEVAAMTADFIGATEVGKSIRNFDLQKYINKSLDWLYNPKKKGAEAWFGGIPAEISKMFNNVFTEDRKKELSKTFDKILKFIYNEKGEGEFVDKVFGGIFRPIEDARKAIVDAYSNTEGEGFEKFTNFFYNPSDGKILGGLLDSTIDTLKDKFVGITETIQEKLNESFSKLTVMVSDVFNTISYELPEAIYNTLPKGVKNVMYKKGMAPQRIEAARRLIEIEEELPEAQERLGSFGESVQKFREDFTDEQIKNSKFLTRQLALRKKGVTNAMNDIKRLIAEQERLKKEIIDITMGRDSSGSSSGSPGPLLKNDDYYKNILNEKPTYQAARFVAFQLFGARGPKAASEEDNKLFVKTFKRADSIEGFKNLDAGTQAALMQTFMYMDDSSFNKLANSETFKNAVKNKNYNRLVGFINPDQNLGNISYSDLRNIADPNTSFGTEMDIKRMFGPNPTKVENVVVTDNSIKRAGDVVTVTGGGGGTTNSSDSAKNLTNYGYSLMNL